MGSRRLAYLEALEVQAWVRRAPPESPLPAPAPEQHAQPSAVSPVPPIEPPEAPGPVTVSPVGGTLLPVQSVESAPPAPATDLAGVGWSELRERVASCTRCGELVANRSQTVFGGGNPSAGWLIIGEAPGVDEDRQGEPFVGRAGQLLDAMLRAIGLDRSTAYIANALKCRPPNDRDPQPEEAEACWPFLDRQITLVNPKVILVVGRVAARHLLGTDEPIGRLRGTVHHYSERRVPLVVTYHPADLLRSPGEKRKAWEDLKLALRTYRAAEGSGS